MTVLPSAATDSRGLIIDQSMTGAVPFGHRGSVRCGCGWIGAYNLHLLRGDNVDAAAVARKMNRMSPFSGTFGVNVFCLYLYLLLHGFRPLLYPVTGSCRRLGRQGIIMYRVGKGGHYAAYEKTSDGRYRYYNVIYGRADYHCSHKQFMARHSRWKLALVIKVGKNNS